MVGFTSSHLCSTLYQNGSFIFLDGTVSIEDKGLEDDSEIDGDDDIFGLLSQDYVVDKQEVPNIEELDESVVPILAHKDSRNLMETYVNKEDIHENNFAFQLSMTSWITISRSSHIYLR